MRAPGRLTGMLMAAGVVVVAAAVVGLLRRRPAGVPAGVEAAIGEGLSAGAASSAAEPDWIRVDGFVADGNEVEAPTPEAATALPAG